MWFLEMGVSCLCSPGKQCVAAAWKCTVMSQPGIPLWASPGPRAREEMPWKQSDSSRGAGGEAALQGEQHSLRHGWPCPKTKLGLAQILLSALTLLPSAVHRGFWAIHSFCWAALSKNVGSSQAVLHGLGPWNIPPAWLTICSSSERAQLAPCTWGSRCQL